MRSSLSPTLPIISLVLLLAVTSAHAERPKVVVAPIARGDALVVTADVARSLAQRLAKQKKTRPLLAYPLPVAAPPKKSSKRAAKLVKQAFEGFQMLEFSSVRKKAKKAMKIYKDELKAGAPPANYIEAAHLLAAAELFDGKETEAFKRMNDAVIWDRSPPAKKKFNPTVQALHSKVLAETEHTGSLTLNVKPDALLWLNRRLQGPAHGKIEVRAGLYLARIARPGYATWRLWVRVHPGQNRDIGVQLKKAPTPESPALLALRREARSVPGPAVAQLTTDFEADETLLVGAKDGCTPVSCTIMLRWAKGSSWKQQNEIAWRPKDPTATAKMLLAEEAQRTQPSLVPTPSGNPTSKERRCMLDSQCYNNERCSGGVCKRTTSITSKWWFWTIIGVAAAGVVTAIAVPLAQPSNPVIELR